MGITVSFFGMFVALLFKAFMIPTDLYYIRKENVVVLLNGDATYLIPKTLSCLPIEVS